jgi:hypothetical protein
MRLPVSILVIFTSTCVAVAGDKPAALTSKEISEGWISLFDGETTFGWSIEGKAKIEDGMLSIGGSSEPTIIKTTSAFRCGELRAAFRVYGNAVKFGWQGDSWQGPTSDFTVQTFKRSSRDAEEIVIMVPPKSLLEIRGIEIHPTELRSIFNGTDLSGWRQFKGDPKREKSQFKVDKDGLLRLTNGPGDLQTEAEFDDFILQIECLSNGKHLNSGVFFRCLPRQYQQGYEAQIQNGYKDDDRTKPIDYGTGAIYRRQPARKVVSNDHEWFTMTIVAQGNHLATWVNGYQTTDFTDNRPPNDNARNGCKTGAGPISLQGHDATTDLSFRNIRIAEWKKRQPYRHEE